MKNKHTIIILLITSLITGCAAPTRIISNKSDSYNKEPKNVLLITDIGASFGTDFTNAFSQKFTDIFQQCGSSVAISRISTLELDENIHLKKIEELKPDSILRISRNGGTKDQYGRI